MSREFMRPVAAAGLLIAVITTVAGLSRPVGAQPFQYEPYEERRYESKRPQRGYEGFPAPGVYCSYRREPNRVCTYDKRGRQKCRIESWTLVQSCS
jgi:hypothetical protein